MRTHLSLRPSARPQLRLLAVVLAAVAIVLLGATRAAAAAPPAFRGIELMPQRFVASTQHAPTSVERDSFTVSWFTWVQWPVPRGTSVSDYYGHRSCSGCSAFHEGLDLDPGNGTPIQSIADGVVVQTGSGPAGLGTYAVIEHRVDGGWVSSWYGHMQSDSLAVSVGDDVARGQVIGAVGTTGQSTGPHLHFAISIGGEYIDPLPWMEAHVNS